MAEKNAPRAKKIILETKKIPNKNLGGSGVDTGEDNIGGNETLQDLNNPQTTGAATNQESPQENQQKEQNDGGGEEDEGKEKEGNEEKKEDNKGEQEDQKDEGGPDEENKDKKGGAAEEVKKKALENATAAAAGAVTGGTGAAAVKGLSIFNNIAKYGKYIVIFFIICLLFLYLVMVSGIYGGTGPQQPIDAKKNARDIEKVKAVTVNSKDKEANDALYRKITDTDLAKSIEDLKSYLTENKNGLDPGEISEINTQLDGISGEFASTKSDLDKLRKLEAKKETDLKLKDPDEFTERSELRKKVDDKFSKMWTTIREIFSRLELNNA